MKAEVTVDRVRLAARDAARQIARTPVVSAVAALSVALALAVIALHVFVLGHTDAALDAIGRDLSATLHLEEDATREGVGQLIEEIARDPLVTRVVFRSAEEERERVVAILSAELLEGVDDDAIPSPPVIWVEFVPEPLDEGRFDAMVALTERLAAAAPVASVVFEADHVGVLFATGDLFRVAGLLFGLVALLVALAFVALFVRVGLDRREAELTLLRAVGATEPYLYAPVAVTASLIGLAGGALGAIIALLVDGRLGALEATVPRLDLDLSLVGPGLFAWCLLGGLGLAWAAAWVTVQRHRR